jgi:ABC-type glycerol-3-phosphate transport system substrate-binding protein
LYSQLEAALYGDLPSLVSLSSSNLARLDSSARLMVDLQPYTVDSLWGLSAEERAGMLPLFWDQDLVSGKRLGVPFYRSLQLLYYNNTWADELGFDAHPETIQELKEQLCAAAGANMEDDDPANNRTGGWLVNTGVETTASWMYAFDAQIESASRGSYDLDQTRTLQVFAYLRGLYAGGCSWVDGLSSPSQEFAGRRALVISASLTAIPDIEDALQKAGSQDEWEVLPYPGNSGDPSLDAFGPSLGVVKSDPAGQMAAWIFARYLLSPDVQQSLVESLGVLPVSHPALDALQEYRNDHLQWAEAAALLDLARTEPSIASWSVARWTLHDAMVEIYRLSFTDEQLSDLVQLFSDTLDELEDLY